MEDSRVGITKQALKKLEQSLDNPPGRLKLDYFSQSNFIGLFVQEDYYKYLTGVTAQFVAELKKSGKTVNPLYNDHVCSKLSLTLK